MSNRKKCQNKTIDPNVPDQIPAYQSPIELKKCDTIKLDQCIKIDGKNIHATYDSDHQVFEVTDKVILKIGSKKYQLDEYHFHIPGEHKVNDKIYPSEIHYVFIELPPGEKHRNKNHKCSNICGGDMPESGNILAVGRVIKNKHHSIDLEEMQVKLPSSYYEYDGTLTTGLYSPIRWILGDHPIHLKLKDIAPIAKTARPLQDFDGRIILYSDKN